MSCRISGSTCCRLSGSCGLRSRSGARSGIRKPQSPAPGRRRYLWKRCCNFFARASTPGMRRTAVCPECDAWSGTTRRREGQFVRLCAVTDESRPEFAAGDLHPGCDGGRAIDGGARARTARIADRLAGYAKRSTAPERTGRSSPAVCCSKQPGLPRSHPGGPCVHRIGNTEKARAAMSAEPVVLGEHGRDLAFRGAINACVGPALFREVQVRLCFFQALEAQAFQGCLLGVAYARFQFALTIRIWHAARKSDGAPE